MLKRRILFAILIAILLIPLWMWLAWLLTPKKKFVFAIVDKTVLTRKGQEHTSLTWMLNNNSLTKTPTQRYKVSHDYFGFFPGDQKQYKIKGLERFSSEQLNQLSVDADAAYFTDTYGIYRNEWYGRSDINARSPIIYGGLSSQDVEFLKDMKARHKLILAEFNTLNTPTVPGNRYTFENLFGLHWTGWMARYFVSFDTATNKDLPRWLVRDYMNEHHQRWPFHNTPGVAYVSDGDQVVVLIDSVDLTDPMPHILTAGYAQQHLSLPPDIKYSYWIDVITPDLSVNHVLARFDVKVNKKGTEQLRQWGIPSTFPAILMHRDTDYRFYYFSGDFCDNPIGMGSSYFKGIQAFKWLYYNSEDLTERGGFFWNFYRPMMQHILDDNMDLASKK